MASSDTSALARKICKLRAERSWSANKVARKLKVSPSTYRGWEKNGKVSAESLLDLAAIYSVSVSALLGQKQESNIQLASAIRCFEEGLTHVKNALVHL
jgi:transcriptional regulator with XRE-family HTH domain